MEKLQFLQGGQVQRTTGLRSVGVDFQREIAQQLEDQKFQAEQQAALAKVMDQVRLRPQATYSKPKFPQPEDRGFLRPVDHRGRMK